MSLTQTDHETSAPQATRFRSTWIVASLEGLRAAGYYDDYRATLRSHQAEIDACIANTWIPMEVARAHYDACDRLGMSDAAYVAMSRMGSGVRRKWLARLIATAERPDATPWSVLPSLVLSWSRTVDGGFADWGQVADHEALLDYVGCELFEIGYYRRAVGFMAHMLLSRTCKHLLVVESPERRPHAVSYRLTWDMR